MDVSPLLLKEVNGHIQIIGCSKHKLEPDSVDVTSVHKILDESFLSWSRLPDRLVILDNSMVVFEDWFDAVSESSKSSGDKSFDWCRFQANRFTNSLKLLFLLQIATLSFTISWWRSTSALFMFWLNVSVLCCIVLEQL